MGEDRWPSVGREGGAEKKPTATAAASASNCTIKRGKAVSCDTRADSGALECREAKSAEKKLEMAKLKGYKMEIIVAKTNKTGSE